MLERITIDEAVCNGKPVIRGFRLTVKTVLEYLAAGESVENILAAYPFLEEDDIKACIEFAFKRPPRFFPAQLAANRRTSSQRPHDHRYCGWH